VGRLCNSRKNRRRIRARNKMIFRSEFDKEKRDSNRVGRVVTAEEERRTETILKKAKLFDYR
jgi:hypothetical protein